MTISVMPKPNTKTKYYVTCSVHGPFAEYVGKDRAQRIAANINCPFCHEDESPNILETARDFTTANGHHIPAKSVAVILERTDKGMFIAFEQNPAVYLCDYQGNVLQPGAWEKSQ